MAFVSPQEPTRSPPPRYEQDYYRWLAATVRALQARDWDAIELPALIEELADMGKRERRALESHLERLVLHLLKYRFQPERRSERWIDSIEESRGELARILRDSPSLRQTLEQAFDECYQRARRRAIRQTQLPASQIPEAPPFRTPNRTSAGG